MPKLMSQLDERLLTEKTIASIAAKLTVVEKNRQDYAAERAHDHDHDH
jgi:hypothetical protein